MFKIVKQIEFINDTSIKQFNEIYYGFRRKFFEKGSLVLKEGDDIDSIYIVISGMLELQTDFDGNLFTV